MNSITVAFEELVQKHPILTILLFYCYLIVDPRVRDGKDRGEDFVQTFLKISDCQEKKPIMSEWFFTKPSLKCKVLYMNSGLNPSKNINDLNYCYDINTLCYII